jgi:hypothetical protein
VNLRSSVLLSEGPNGGREKLRVYKSPLPARRIAEKGRDDEHQEQEETENEVANLKQICERLHARHLLLGKPSRPLRGSP